MTMGKPAAAAALVALGFAAGCVYGAARPVAHGQSPAVVAALDEASRVYGVPYRVLACLAWKESRFEPLALNRAGPYVGLVQWSWPTWRYAVATLRNPAAPEWPLLPPDATPYRPRDAALAAAGLMSRGEGRHWPTLRGCGRG